MKKSIFLATSAAIGLASFSVAPAPAQAQSDPVIGQLMAVGFNFCPRGWANSDGQLLSIAQNTALFSLLGTTYGGDGRTTFALPDLRGRAPIHAGGGPGLPLYSLGQKGGSTSFTLTVAQMPSHNHTGTLRASTAVGNSANPNGKTLAIDNSGDRIYHTAGATNDMSPGILKIDNAGGNQSVNKVSPYLAVNWCIALQGIFPSRS